MVHCFIDAIFGHSLGPGVSTQAGRGRSSPKFLHLGAKCKIPKIKVENCRMVSM